MLLKLNIMSEEGDNSFSNEVLIIMVNNSYLEQTFKELPHNNKAFFLDSYVIFIFIAVSDMMWSCIKE